MDHSLWCIGHLFSFHILGAELVCSVEHRDPNGDESYPGEEEPEGCGSALEVCAVKCSVLDDSLVDGCLDGCCSGRSDRTPELQGRIEHCSDGTGVLRRSSLEDRDAGE